MAEALYTVLADPRCLPNIKPVNHRTDGSEIPQYQTNYTRRPRPEDVRVYQFPQWWASGLAGFPAERGMDTVLFYTTVIVSGPHAAVCYDGEYSYTVKIGSVFTVDLHRMSLVSLEEMSERYERVKFNQP